MFVGERIKEKLKETGRRQEDLEAVLQRDQSAISRKLDGKTPLTIDDLNKIAAFLDCEAADFFPPKLGNRIAETMATVPFTDFVKFLVKDEVEKHCAELKAELLQKNRG
jgi:transcriptional regulator with XRE-family HTH domain